MDSRESILKRLHQEGTPEALPPVWQSSRSFPDLPSRFKEALEAAGGEVYLAENLEEAWRTLIGILKEAHARFIVVEDEAPLNSVDFKKNWPEHQWHIIGVEEGALREVCELADVGLSSASAALAETGSIIVESGPGKSRLATLLPPVHIAVVPTSKLTTDIFTWTVDCGTEMPANLTMISGPSKSADIEFQLTMGVHGPKRMIVILYAID
ncbi:MAG: hypothetical protein GTO18_16495 [Anaerolineales bacterium]|nr:hypothetical protein [Anaerolineales bacterium]